MYHDLKPLLKSGLKLSTLSPGSKSSMIRLNWLLYGLCSRSCQELPLISLHWSRAHVIWRKARAKPGTRITTPT